MNTSEARHALLGDFSRTPICRHAAAAARGAPAGSLGAEHIAAEPPHGLRLPPRAKLSAATLTADAMPAARPPTPMTRQFDMAGFQRRARVERAALCFRRRAKRKAMVMPCAHHGSGHFISSAICWAHDYIGRSFILASTRPCLKLTHAPTSLCRQ